MIAWPAPNRNFAAPTTAAAARITFPGAGPNGTELSQVVERPTTDPFTKTYTLGFGVRPGTYLMVVEFLGNRDSMSAVAKATVNVRVGSDGSLRRANGGALGTVALDAQITGFFFENLSVEVGKTRDLEVVAYTKTGIAAVRPGTVNFEITEGANNLRANADGTFTGLAEGTATVVSSADGVVGRPETITVLATPLATRIVNVAASDSVVDPNSARLWISLPSTAANGDSVQSVDFTTGTLGTPIRVGGNPSVLAISDDGTTLYAGLSAIGAIRKIDLTTGTPVSQYTIPSSVSGETSYAIDLQVQPGATSTVAVTAQRFTNSGYNGPEIFDDGVKRSNGLGVYQGDRFVWTSANRLVAYNTRLSDDSLLDVAVDAQGATVTRSTRVGLYSGNWVFAEGRLFSSTGITLDANSLSRLGAFPLDLTNSYDLASGPAVDPTARRAYFVTADFNGTLRLQTFDLDTYARVSTRRIDVSETAQLLQNRRNSLLRVGARGLALRLADRIVLIDDVPGL